MLDALLASHGYGMLILGLILEGEIVVILASFLAHQGHFSLPFVIILASLITILENQIYFFIGRKYGRSVIARHKFFRNNFKKVERLLNKHQIGFIFFFRYLFGLKILSALTIGSSKIKTKNFVMMNIIGGLVWALLFSSIGYLFGFTLNTWFGNIKHIESEILLTILIFFGFFWIIKGIKKLSS